MDNTTQLDLTKLFEMSYEDAQQFAKDLREEGVTEMAEVLEGLDPSFFELSQSQQKLSDLASFLKHNQVPEEDVIQMISQIVNIASTLSQAEIVGLMDDNLKSKWDSMMAHSPNVFQMQVLLEYVVDTLSDKSYDEIFEGQIETLTDAAINRLEHEMQTTGAVSSLSEEQAQSVLGMLDQGEYEKAMTLIYSSNK